MYFSTTSVPADIRYEAWRQAVSAEIGPFAMDVGDARFEASLEGRRLGAIDAIRISQNGRRVRRTRREIEAGDPRVFFLLLQMSGRTTVEQSERHVDLNVGDITLLDSARPLAFHLNGKAAHLCFHIPRESLEGRGVDWSRAVATRWPRAPARLLGGLMQMSFEQAGCLDAAPGQSLGEAIAALVASSRRDPAARRAGGEEAPARLAAIQAFLLENLSDDALTPRAVAAAHGISERQLHRIFAASGDTVGRWIRKARLDRCAAELRDPRQNGRSITDIALSHGFKDCAHFSTAFRETFDVSPRQYRVQANRESA